MNEEKKSVQGFLATIFFPITSTLEFLQKYFKGIILLILIVLLLATIPKERIERPNLITIKLKGAILDAQNLIEQINEAQKSQYKGVLFVVDSPGGAVAPSIEISQAIKRLKAKKPVVTYAAGMLTSGGYYASIHSNKIVANPGAIVGSIGVIFETPMVKGLLDKIGIEPQVVKAGRYKEVGTPFRPWKPYEKAEIKKVIEDTYQMFVQDVCKARGLACQNQERFADAHIFTARQAKEVGLVDMVGTIDIAKKEVEKLAKVKKAIWKKPSKLERMLKKLSNETASQLASLLLGSKLF